MKLLYCEDCANKYGLPGAVFKTEIIDGEQKTTLLPLQPVFHGSNEPIGGVCYICGIYDWYAHGKVDYSDERLKGVNIFYRSFIERCREKRHERYRKSRCRNR